MQGDTNKMNKYGRIENRVQINKPDFLDDPVSFDIKILSPAVANILLHTDLFGSYGQTEITTSPKKVE